MSNLQRQQGHYETTGPNEQVDEILNSLVHPQSTSHLASGSYNGHRNYYGGNESNTNLASNNYYYPQEMYPPPPPNPYQPFQNSRPPSYSYIDNSPAYPTPQQQVTMPMPNRYQPVDINVYPPPEYHQHYFHHTVPHNNTYGHHRTPSQETYSHQRTPSQETYSHQRTPSQDTYGYQPSQDTYGHQKTPSQDTFSYGHQKTPSQDTFSYGHQKTPSQDTFSYGQQKQTESYPPMGYSDRAQEYITNSYRPTFTQSATDSLPNTPPIKPKTHKRNSSSLRKNMIVTIERPRFDHYSESDLKDEDEVPFIPVSPDSSNDDEDGYFEKKPEKADKPSQEDVLAQAKPDQEDVLAQAKPDQEDVLAQAKPDQEDEPVQAEPIKTIKDSLPDVTEGIESDEDSVEAGPNYGFFSVLSVSLIEHLKRTDIIREIFSVNEHNIVFYGKELLGFIGNAPKKRVSNKYCLEVANSLMTCDPPLFSPTYYSQNSMITRIIGRDYIYFLEESAIEGNLPTGIFTPLTPCYSSTCTPKNQNCYSPKCPNRQSTLEYPFDFQDEDSVSHTLSTTSTTSPEGDWLVSHEAWASRVDRELLESLDKKEIARQEVLNELIYSEEKFFSDLVIIRDVIVEGIRKSNSIDERNVNNFINMVFNNYESLLEISSAMFKELLERARQYDRICLPMIGDIMLNHMVFFEAPFVEYSSNVIISKYIAEIEMKNNPKFSSFVKDVEKHARTSRLSMFHYLLCPVTRMQRYPLLIEAVLKKTPEDHIDYIYLTRCYDVIRNIASRADAAVVNTKRRLAILHIQDSITFRQGEYYDMLLSDPNRRLYRHGILKRRSGSNEGDKTDIYAFVFDHMVLLTKQRKTASGDEYRVWRKPIPLQLLILQNSVKPNQATTFQSFDINPRNNVTNETSLVIYHLGARGGSVYPFFCSSVEEKQGWVKAIEDAKTSLRKKHSDTDVFELKPLDDVNFRNAAAGMSTGTATRVNCSVPFLTKDNESTIAIGTDSGVFFKTEGQDHSVRRIIQCENVLQLGIMEKYHILIVLTEKALRAYPVDILASKTNTKAIDRVEMEIGQNIDFFQLGQCNGRDMLVYMKKKNTRSVFMALEPFCDLRDPKNEKLLPPRSTLFNNRPEYLRWFKKYKDFYVGADACNIHFLRAKLSVVCERGFEVLDPENLIGVREIPDPEDPQFKFMSRHDEPLKPLAMYRINSEFLLCYEKFAFYVNNRNGLLFDRGPGKPPELCEWEGEPVNIVYAHPYIIGIDPYFIEVRHVETGELVQIISGENIRLAFYNGKGENPVIHICMTHNQKPDTQALFSFSLNQRSSAPLRKCN